MCRVGVDGEIHGEVEEAVDILLASRDGSKLLSIQVKTRWSGCRRRWYGHEVWQWDVGAKAVGKHSRNLWYAFVDFAEDANSKPAVFLVPSIWVAKTVGADWSRKIYPLKIECESLCRERWDLIEKYFDDEKDAIQWATTIPAVAKF